MNGPTDGQTGSVGAGVVRTLVIRTLTCNQDTDTYSSNQDTDMRTDKLTITTQEQHFTLFNKLFPIPPTIKYFNITLTSFSMTFLSVYTDG